MRALSLTRSRVISRLPTRLSLSHFVFLVVMSSSPNWKRLFAEGIERFRHEDLVGALESFDEVRLIFSSLSRLIFWPGYPSCGWRILCATRLPCGCLRKAEPSQRCAARRKENHRHCPHPVAWLFSLSSPLCLPQQILRSPAYEFTRTSAPRRGRKTRRTTARAYGPLLPTRGADQVPDRRNAR